MKNSIISEGRVRVWDLPTRLFHWIFAGSFVAAFITHGDARYLDSHVFAGYLFAGLLVFRVIWGVVGSEYARFENFRFSPAAAARYVFALLKHKARRFIGHNPAGSLAIYLMLLLAALVSATGLVVYAGVEQQGPLYPLFTIAQGAAVQSYHELFAWAMLFVVVAHVAGVIVESLFHHENLVQAMISGYKTTSRGLKSVPRYGWLAAVIVIVSVGGGVTTYKGYITQTEDNPYLPYKPVSLPQSESWQSECGDCHIPYHPSLLPQRSWITLFKQQDRHFGDDLALDQDTLEELQQYALQYSAERHLSEAAWYINTTTPLSEAPIRISETAYWKEQHEEIEKIYWENDIVRSKAQCEACHFDAKQGSFQDGAMRLPKINKKKSTLKVAMK